MPDQSPAKKIALIGAGNMGRNHLRVLREMEGAEVAFVVDPLPPPDVRQHGIPWFTDLTGTPLASADAFIVAAPTRLHSDILKALSCQGKPILVEKPLAATYQEAQELRTLLGPRADIFVGHIERFNPAVKRLKALIKTNVLGDVIHCSFVRVGGIPRDIEKSGSVIVDLAIHDIDLFVWLFGESNLVASTRHKFANGIVHTADILLQSKAGPTASIHCNWITPAKLRQIRITGSSGFCVVDLINQTCTFTGGGMFLDPEDPPATYSRFIEYSNGSDTIQFGIMKNEPLRLELRDFINHLNGQETRRLCPVDDAIATLALTQTLNS